MVTLPLRLAVLAWIAAYLPLALRRVYGGSRTRTGLKTVGLGVLYLVVFVALLPWIMAAAMLTF